MKMFMDDTDNYRKLLSSLLWLAVHDSCVEPTKTTGSEYRPTDHALGAIRFFFNNQGGSYFSKYIECLGMEADSFRQRLIRAMYSQESLNYLPYGGLPVNAQKSFRFNHTYWLTHENHQKGDLNAILRQNRRHLGSSVIAQAGIPTATGISEQEPTDDPCSS